MLFCFASLGSGWVSRLTAEQVSLPVIAEALTVLWLKQKNFFIMEDGGVQTDAAEGAIAAADRPDSLTDSQLKEKVVSALSCL